ncbi:MAG: GatB/YqeY domain-containing protein [Oscillospiraceae bacterium]
MMINRPVRKLAALKEKNAQGCAVLLLSALKAKAIDKRADLTEQEENEVVLKEIKQAQEQVDSAPADRADIREQAQARIAVWKEFAPQMMGEQEIRKVLDSVLQSLGIPQPTAKDKGKIMKALMPLVKGKADGGLVNRWFRCWDRREQTDDRGNQSPPSGTRL